MLLAVCLRAPADRRGVYLYGALTTGLGVLLLSPLLWSSPDGTILWEGPTIPVLGPLDVTTTELFEAALNALRLTALGARVRGLRAPRSTTTGWSRLPAAPAAQRSRSRLATRLVPSLERDAAGLAESDAGPRRRARGRTRLRDAALSARRRLARARIEPGERRWRPVVSDRSRRHARAQAAVEHARPAGGPAGGIARPRGGAVALVSVSGLAFSYPAGTAGAARRVARAGGGRGRRAPRPLGRREVDAPALARRARASLPRRPLLRPGGRRRARHPQHAPSRSSPARSRRSSRIRRIRS